MRSVQEILELQDLLVNVQVALTLVTLTLFNVLNGVLLLVKPW